MIRQEVFQGELVDPSSPSPPSEAEQMASFGKYSYDPSQRMTQSIFPGGYGYNAQQNFGYYMNPPQPAYGLGMNPYANPQFYYGAPNPAFQYQQQFYQEPQEIKYFIEPVNFSGEYLPGIDFEERIEKLKTQYWMQEQEEIGKRSVNGSGFNMFGTNYYGVPYYNPYQYNSTLYSEIQQQISELQDQARENRVQLNLHLARLAHNFNGDHYDDSALEERYRGKYVSAPGGRITTFDIQEQMRFANLVPFDNSQMYRDIDAAVSKEYHDIIPETATMKECFELTGVVNATYDLEEEKHRRRNGAVLYDSKDNAYKYFVRAKAAERNKQNDIVETHGFIPPYNPALGNFPTLAQSARITDDGTLSITCNFGSHKGETYTVKNSQEAEYEARKERFNSFYSSIPGAIYLNNPNEGGGSGG